MGLQKTLTRVPAGPPEHGTPRDPVLAPVTVGSGPVITLEFESGVCDVILKFISSVPYSRVVFIYLSIYSIPRSSMYERLRAPERLQGVQPVDLVRFGYGGGLRISTPSLLPRSLHPTTRHHRAPFRALT
jgi:hypothetical protein